MKKFLFICCFVFLAIGLTGLNASALPYMTGDVSFGGKDTLNNGGTISAATAFTSFSDVETTIGDKIWSGVDGNTVVTVNPFSFAPPPGGTFGLFSFVLGGDTFTFDATGSSLTFVKDGTPGLPTLMVSVISGMFHDSLGIYNPTAGVFVLTANEAGTTESFSASAATVPEPGTLLLLGAGLLGLVGLRKKIS